MDSFAVIIIGLVLLVLVAVVLLGLFYPGSGAEQLDWRPTRSPELEAQNDIDDLAQMQAAVNAKRRARGEPEISERQVRERLDREREEQARLLGSRDRDQEVEQLLELQNRRRRERGEPELTREQYERSLGIPDGGS